MNPANKTMCDHHTSRIPRRGTANITSSLDERHIGMALQVCAALADEHLQRPFLSMTGRRCVRERTRAVLLVFD